MGGAFVLWSWIAHAVTPAANAAIDRTIATATFVLDRLKARTTASASTTEAELGAGESHPFSLRELHGQSHCRLDPNLRSRAGLHRNLVCPPENRREPDAALLKPRFQFRPPAPPTGFESFPAGTAIAPPPVPGSARRGSRE